MLYKTIIRLGEEIEFDGMLDKEFIPKETEDISLYLPEAQEEIIAYVHKVERLYMEEAVVFVIYAEEA